MATAKSLSAVMKEIASKYGSTINLEKSPQVLVEIFRKYGRVLDPDGGGGGGGMGSGPTTSSIAVAGPPSGEVQVNNNELLREILKLNKELKALGKAVNK